MERERERERESLIKISPSFHSPLVSFTSDKKTGKRDERANFNEREREREREIWERVREGVGGGLTDCFL